MSRDMVWCQDYQEQAWLNATHNFLKVLACSDVQSVKRSARVAEEWQKKDKKKNREDWVGSCNE